MSLSGSIRWDLVIALNRMSARAKASSGTAMEGRRAAWAGEGVMCDELSTPALVFNLSLSEDTPLARVLRSARNGVEPVHLSLRILLRGPLAK